VQDESNRLRQLIMGFRTTQLLYVAAKYELADHLAKQPLTAPELAAVAQVHPRALYSVLRALASLGVFAEASGGRFEMTPAAELLRRDRPGSLRSSALLYGDELLWRAYGQLYQAVESGKPAFAQLYGEPFYDYLAQHPASGTLFHNAMTGFSELEEAAIIAAYDFSDAHTLVDVGGGQGRLALALLRNHPDLKAVIFDGTPPLEDTQNSFAQAGMATRADFIQGDFFASVPRGGDLYMLKSIIHNWDDAAAVAILSICRQAMPQSARLLVAERVVPPGNGPSEAKLFDINMLVTLGGQERTEEQYATLLNAAGLKLARVIPTKSHLSLIEAICATPS
jgi:hypothetical protein